MKRPFLFLFLTLGLGILPAGVVVAGEPIPVSVKQDVKVAYEATHDTWENGVAKALNTIKKQKEFYRDMGVVKGQLNLHGVFHSDAGYFLLTDQAYRRHTGSIGGNPNRSIIQELSAAGVSIELCAQTMKHNGWKAEDILPSVTVVHDAYTRLADLQLQGFAYLKF